MCLTLSSHLSYPPSYFLPLLPRDKVERLDNWPRQDVENMSHFVQSSFIPSLTLPRPLFPREKVEGLENWPGQDVGKISHFIFSPVIPSPHAPSLSFFPQRENRKTRALARTECLQYVSLFFLLTSPHAPSPSFPGENVERLEN
jgi:hypothetical protein